MRKQAYELHAVHTTILKKNKPVSTNHAAIIVINYTTAETGGRAVKQVQNLVQEKVLEAQ